MADYSTLLRDRVTLECRSLDRIFLQAYVPRLQPDRALKERAPCPEGPSGRVWKNRERGRWRNRPSGSAKGATRAGQSGRSVRETPAASRRPGMRRFAVDPAGDRSRSAPASSDRIRSGLGVSHGMSRRPFYPESERGRAGAEALALLPAEPRSPRRAASWLGVAGNHFVV